MLLLYLIYSPSFSGPISHSCLTYPLFIDDLYTCSYMAYGPAYLAYGPTHIGLMNLLITGLWTHSYLVYEPTHNWFMDLLISVLWIHSYLVYESKHASFIAYSSLVHTHSSLVHFLLIPAYTLHPHIPHKISTILPTSHPISVHSSHKNSL